MVSELIRSRGHVLVIKCTLIRSHPLGLARVSGAPSRHTFSYRCPLLYHSAICSIYIYIYTYFRTSALIYISLYQCYYLASRVHTFSVVVVVVVVQRFTFQDSKDHVFDHGFSFSLFK